MTSIPGPVHLRTAQRIAVLIIDITRGNVEDRWTKDPHVRNILAPIARLLAVARAKQMPVTYTHGGLFSQTAGAAPITRVERGSWIWKVPLNDERGTTNEELEESLQVPPEIAPTPGEVLIRKIKPSGFFESPLLSLLTSQRIDTVIVCGTATNSGVLHTVCDAYSYNLRAIVPRECCATRNPEFHEASLEMMDRIHADVMHLDDILSDLQHRPRQSLAKHGERPLVFVQDAARLTPGSIDATARLIAAARSKNVPVIYAITPANPEVPSALAPGPEEAVIQKPRPSAFLHTPLTSFLTY